MKIIYNVTLFIFLVINFAIAKENSLNVLITEEELLCAKKSYKILKIKGYNQAINIAKSCPSEVVEQMINWQAIIDNKITKSKFMPTSLNIPSDPPGS